MKYFLSTVFVTVFMFLCYSNYAQVMVSPARGGTDICTNLAENRLPPNGAPVGLDTIMIRETSPGDFAAGIDSIELKIPSGWYLWTSSPYVAFVHTSGMSEIDSVQLAYAYDHISLYFRPAHTSVLDTIIMGGFGIVALTDTAHTSQIYAASSYGVTGITASITGTNFCSLSLSPQPINVNYLIWCNTTATASDSTPGGRWSSIDTTVAVVNPTTGLVTARGFGYDTLIYTVDTCWMKHPIRVYCEGAVPLVNSKTGSIHIFPNPAHAALTIQSDKELIHDVAITNLVGQVVSRVHTSTVNSVEVDVDGLPPGMYAVRVNGGETLKWVKE